MCHSIKKLFLSVPVLLILFASCKKYVAGPKGDPGTPGLNGNVKQYSIVVNQASAVWTFNGGWWTSSLDAPTITDGVIERGDVKVYVQVGTEWWALPYAVGNLITQCSVENSVVHLKYYKIHNGPPAMPDNMNFRIVTMVPVD